MTISPNLTCLNDREQTEEDLRSFLIFVRGKDLGENHLVGLMYFLVYIPGRDTPDGFSCEFPPTITEHFFSGSRIGWVEVTLFYSGERILVMDVIGRMDTPKEWEEALIEVFEEWKDDR